MELNFDKNGDGLLPAIIQDADTQLVLMLGFMNRESYEKTVKEGKVCFYSRTRKKLWTKGETSGNFLNVVSIKDDCDNDTLLIKVHPVGPVCHTGADTCFEETNELTLLKNLQERVAKSKNLSAAGANGSAADCAALAAKLEDLLTDFYAKGVKFADVVDLLNKQNPL